MLSKAHRPVRQHVGVWFVCSKGRISAHWPKQCSPSVRNSAWCTLASSQSAHMTPGQRRLGQGEGSSAGVPLQLLCHWLQGSSTRVTRHSVCRAAERESRNTSVAFPCRALLCWWQSFCSVPAPVLETCCHSPLGVHICYPTAALHSDSKIHLLRGPWAPPAAQNCGPHRGVHTIPKSSMAATGQFMAPTASCCPHPATHGQESICETAKLKSKRKMALS